MESNRVLARSSPTNRHSTEQPFLHLLTRLGSMTVNTYAACQNLARNRLRNRNQSSDRPSSCFYPPHKHLLKSPRQRGGDGRVHARSARRSTDTLRHSFFTVFPSDGVRHGVVRVTQTPSPSASLRPGNLSFLGFNTTKKSISVAVWTRHPPPSIARPAHPAGIAPDIEADIHPRPSHPRTPATTRATWTTTSSASPSEDVSNT